ncbi:MAG: putative large multi-functional protein [Pedosphaera sp.]|nr:putative large multi-functional protein [Pedosphaera sp.]
MKMNIRNALAACFAIFTLTALAGDSKPISLFNGKDLSGWKALGKPPVQWKYGKAALDTADPTKLLVEGEGAADEIVSPEKGVNLSSEATFGDCLVELEFMVAKDSNSGVKLMNIYEIQIFDSFGKEVADKLDSGAVYSETAPKLNAAKKPGEWQTLSIDFRAPRFDASGMKTANAKFVKVVMNGQVVQENVEIAHGTNVSRNAKEHPTGPIYLQGDHGPVAFRNFKVTPIN